MKWIAVILIMLNVAAYLVGLNLDPDAPEIVSSAPFETINEAAMSVIKPESRRSPVAAQEKAAAPELLEDQITRLKIDNQGQVLTTGRVKPTQEKPAVAAVKPAAVATTKIVRRVEPNPILQPRNVSQKAPATVAVKPVPAAKPERAAKPKPVAAAPALVPSEPAPLPEPAAEPQSKVKPAPEPVPVVGAKPEKPAPAAVVQREPLACYRLGPFDDQAELTAVRRKLKSRSIDFKLEEKTLPGDVKGARVYIGGFSDSAAMAQEKQRLKRLKVDNYEVSLNGNSVLQLGYFKSAVGAGKAQNELKAKGIDAKIYTIYNSTRIESWLVLVSAPRDKVKTLTLPKGVQAKEQPCS